MVSSHTKPNAINKNDYIILFDGICNLCNSWVTFILKYDKANRFRFGTLQSETAKDILKQHQHLRNNNSVVLILDTKAYSHSRAVLEIFRRIGFPWNVFYVFIILPPFIRDAVYNVIARNRYRWFGNKDQCTVPDENTKSRFI